MSWLGFKTHRETLLTDFIVGFFIGGAVSSIAQDPSDVLFFYASAQGWLANTGNQTFFWYILPFILYGAFALTAYVIGRFTERSPLVVLWVFAGAVLLSAVYSYTLPQVNSLIFDATVFGATVVSMVVVYGIFKQSRRFRR